MTYILKLNKKPFEQIEKEIKTIEMRLDYDSRKDIKVGDEIIFISRDDETRKLRTKVVDLHRFSSFEELYKNLDLLKCGYTAESIGSASYLDMEEYYPKEKQKLYGVVGIEIELQKN